MSACLDDNVIAALLEGEVPPAERARVAAHIDTCATCRAIVADAAREGPAPGPRILRAGTTLGRYVVLDTVGSGAMGVVYAAYDPELGRKVALKLLRPDPLEERAPNDARERLLREAQALAKLSHPHVITIHDVGTLDGEVFLTMEFVEGGTLGDWLRAQRRSWRAVVHLLCQVGEGLAAAHEAGLVHRDLKPENILVGVGERVRVTDFGLARDAGDASAGGGAATTKDKSVDVRLTVTGRLLGTPAYMAPEQLAGGAADAGSDQFAFCVTLYEALYGERPFAGNDVGSLAASIAEGAVRAPPAPRSVPAWLRRIVLRGLAGDRARRFPSMRALLQAIRSGPVLAPRRVALAAAALVLVSGAAFGALRKPTVMCTGAELAWNGAWDDARADAVRGAFQRSGRPSQDHAFHEVDRIMGDLHARWSAMHQDTCLATRARGEQSELVLDARMRCLDDRRKEVAALAHLLGDADGELVDRSVTATLSLPPLDRCQNLRELSLEAPLPPSPDARARIERLGDRLAEASALEYAGKYTEGLRVSTPALEEARAAGFAPLIAKLLFVEGRLAAGERDYARAEATLHEAAAVAEEAHEDMVAADAWITLVRTVGFIRARPEEGRLWARYAESALRRAGGDDEREATRLRNLATAISRHERKYEEARVLSERSRALYDLSHGARYDFQIAAVDEVIAGIAFETGRPDEALPLYRHTAEVRERLFGAEHPSLAVSYVNVGESLTALGRADEAIVILQKALSIATRTGGTGGDGYYRHRLAAALRAKGAYVEALAEDRGALAASAESGETGGYWESWSLTGIGLDLLALSRPAEAVDPLERAVRERSGSGVSSFELAESRFALARALWETGETGAKTRGRALATETRDAIAADAARFGSMYAKTLAAIEAWLASHPSG